MKKLSSLSIFFPSLNDATILPELIRKATENAKKVTSDFEIIVINDGSIDNTEEVLQKLKKNNPFLKSVHHKINRGYGGALISGFNASTKDWVFYTDGDGQYDVNELPLLVEILEGDTTVVNGFKIQRDDSIVRKMIGSTYNLLLHFLYKVPVSDIDCDFRLIKKSTLSNITLHSNSGLICLELLLKLQKNKACFKEMGVHHFARRFGKSQFFSIKHLVKTLREHISFYIKRVD